MLAECSKSAGRPDALISRTRDRVLTNKRLSAAQSTNPPATVGEWVLRLAAAQSNNGASPIP